MVSIVTVAMVFVGCLSLTSAQLDTPDMFGLMNLLYFKADPNFDRVISLAELGDLFDSMDINDDSRIERDEFVNSWVALTGLHLDIAEAFFLLWDLNNDGELDDHDNRMVYTVFDLDSNGIVTSDEFNEEFQNIYHRIPFVVLFERVERANHNDQHINKDEFSTLFASFTNATDGSVSAAEFQNSWVQSQFGTVDDANFIIKSFDTNQDGVISKDEVAAKFSSLDKSGNGTLEIREAYVLGDVVPHAVTQD